MRYIKMRYQLELRKYISTLYGKPSTKVELIDKCKKIELKKRSLISTTQKYVIS